MTQLTWTEQEIYIKLQLKNVKGRDIFGELSTLILITKDNIKLYIREISCEDVKCT